MDFRILIVGAASAGFLGLSGCASAPESTETASAEQDGEEVICRRSHDVGSRLGARRCMTRAEWEAEAQEARDALERNSNNRTVDPFAPGGPGR